MKPLHQFKNIYNPYSTNVSNDQPSLHAEAAITDAVKPVDREIADIEAEKDEIILKPDLSGIYKIKGKRHSQGGSPIKAEAGSFIFSDFNKLAISKKDQELMELKKGGPVGKQKNTPAEVVQRNVDIKHYNRLINNLSDINKDEISKRTSTLMLEKYKDTLGRIAYLQEEKKNFETGVPDFAQDTAPAIHPELEYNIDKQEQYKNGGMVNPYLQTMQKGGGWGLWKGDKLPTFKNKFGVTNAASLDPLDEIATELGYPGEKNNEAFQKWLYGSSALNKSIIDKLHIDYGDPINKMFDGKIGIRWQEAIEAIRKQKKPVPAIYNPPPHTQIDIPLTNTPAIPEELNPNKPQGTYLPYEPNVKKTLPMMEDEMWAGVDAASVKKYNPYRQQVKSQLVDFERYNPQTAVNRSLQASNSAYNATRGMNPYQAAAAINEVHGKSLESVSQIQGQYDERNVGQANQQNQSNVGIQNKDLGDNITFDKKYYDEQTLANQRFDNAKTYAWGQFRDTRNRNRETLDSLYNVLAQQPIAGSKQLTDRNGKPILGKDGKPMFQAMPLYDVIPGTIRTRYTGVGNVLNANINSNASDAYTDGIYRELMEKLNDGTLTKEQALYLNGLERTRAAQRKAKGYKIGGIVNPYTK